MVYYFMQAIKSISLIILRLNNFCGIALFAFSEAID